MSREHVHRIPWFCRIFGHRMHNATSRGYMLAEDRCTVRGCPGPDHVWSEFESDPQRGPDDYIRHCTIGNCDEVWRLHVPDMSAPVARPNPARYGTEPLAAARSSVLPMGSAAERAVDLMRGDLEQRLRNEIADEIHKIRFDGGVGSVPDMYFWGVTHAERIVRGER